MSIRELVEKNTNGQEIVVLLQKEGHTTVKRRYSDIPEYLKNRRVRDWCVEKMDDDEILFLVMI